MAFLFIKPLVVDNAFIFQCGMVIDADGAKQAYRPDGEGLDSIKNAMTASGRYVGVLTGPDGKPLTTPDGDYISTTSLQDTTKAKNDPARYVDAGTVPYLAVCPEFLTMGVKLGDVSKVFRQDMDTGLMLADTSPHNHWGECGVAAAPGVGLSGSALVGGVESGCTYIVFKNSASMPAWPRVAGDSPPWAKSVVDFQLAAQNLFDTWGGLARLKTLVSL